MKCFLAVETSSGINYPCRQCMPCRINLARDWTTRILLEQSMHPQHSAFVTLTYDDKTVPKTDAGVPTLRKKKFDRWLAKTIERRTPGLRYYHVGEYGDNTFRPHHHLCVFPDNYRQIQQFADAWKNGYVSAYPLTPQRAAYCAAYTTKKLTKDSDQRLEPGQEPEYRSSSRRPPIGSAFIHSMVARYRGPYGRKVLAERGDVERNLRISGKLYPVPKYVLRHVRRELGIPETHVGRIDANPLYAAFFAQENPVWDEDQHKKQMRHINAKKITKESNNTIRI